MIRGEYEFRIAGDAPLVIPNQFTTVGMQTILRAAFWKQQVPLWLCLGGRNPADMLSLIRMQEPDETSGYTRQVVPMDQTNWPVLGSVNGESYIESREVTFELTSAISVPVNRFFMTDGTQVISVSSALPTGLQLYDSAISSKYRLFFR